MSRQDPLYVWTKELTKTFPALSKPQLKGLAEWSFGMVLARCCSLDSVASYMADWLGQPELSVRSRLREWYLPADRKSISSRGDKARGMWKSTQGRVLAPFSGAAGTRSVPSHQWRATLMDASTQQFETLIRSAARRLKGHHRRLFLAEVTTRLCDGNPRQAER